MAVSPLKTWVAGEVLTASDLNSEFLQVYNNGQTLGWPATTGKDFDGQTLTLDADGDTSMTAGNADDRIDWTLSAKLLFQMDGTVSTPVNGYALVAAATGVDPSLEVFGDDTNIGFNIVTKGTGAATVNGVVILGVGFESSDQAILPTQIFG